MLVYIIHSVYIVLHETRFHIISREFYHESGIYICFLVGCGCQRARIGLIKELKWQETAPGWWSVPSDKCQGKQMRILNLHSPEDWHSGGGLLLLFWLFLLGLPIQLFLSISLIVFQGQSKRTFAFHFRSLIHRNIFTQEIVRTQLFAWKRCPCSMRIRYP